jgi:DNA modification methylase
MEIIRTEITELIPDDRNGNKGTERGSKMLQASITRCGAGRSVLIDRNGKLIGGNKTQQAAIAAGVKSVVVVRTDGTELVAVQRTDLDLDNDPEARELAWADNRVQEISYDPDIERLLEDIDKGIDLSAYYDDGEINAMMEAIGREVEKEEGEREGGDGEDSEDINSRCEFGQIWQLGRHRLMCGDSTDEKMVERLIGDQKIDIIWSDAPYGIDLLKGKAHKLGKSKVYQPIAGDGNKDVAKEAFKLFRKYSKATQFWWGANHFCEVLPDSSCWIIWDKQDGKSVTYADCELCWTNMTSPARIFKHIWDGFRRDSEQGEERIHVNQKPIELCNFCFTEYCKDKNVIFDPFCGSGISIMSAEELNKTVLAIEILPENCELAIRRWEKIGGEEAVLVSEC